jgi:phenylacetate-coenzyme A ligase PaaK-like adenylate-forming protein
VLPYYGCGEIQSLGYSCPQAPGTYHTCDEHAVIEVEAPDGRTALEGEGPFLITDLDNGAFPMIRYRNGDAGKIAAPGCPCGRTLGRIVRVDGRLNDVLITTSGAAISGIIGTHAFRIIRNVDAFQIVQRRPGQAVIKIVRGPGYNATLEEPKVFAIFGKHLGEGADIAIEYPDSLPKTAAGKARFMINEYLAAQAQAPKA